MENNDIPLVGPDGWVLIIIFSFLSLVGWWIYRTSNGMSLIPDSVMPVITWVSTRRAVSASSGAVALAPAAHPLPRGEREDYVPLETWLRGDDPHIQVIKLSTIAQEDNVLVAGPKGSGKTTLLRTMLPHRQHVECVALDPHNSPGKWPCPIIGGGEDYAAIDRAMRKMHADMVNRFKALNAGATKEGQFPRRTVVGDEFYGIAQELNGKGGTVHAGDMLSKRLARGRKVGECVFVASQNETVKALGIEGNADIKLCFDYIVFLGALIGTRAKYHGCPDDVQHAAFTQARPAVVWHPERNNWYVLAYDLAPVKEGHVLNVSGNRETADHLIRRALREEDEQIGHDKSSVEIGVHVNSEIQNSELVNRLNSAHESRELEFNSSSIQPEMTEIARRMRSELNLGKNKIIEILFGAKPGGTKAYRDASAWYDSIIE